jgi:hypothetical protein
MRKDETFPYNRTEQIIYDLEVANGTDHENAMVLARTLSRVLWEFSNGMLIGVDETIKIFKDAFRRLDNGKVLSKLRDHSEAI